DAQAVNVVALIHAAGGEQLAVRRVRGGDSINVGGQSLQLSPAGNVEEYERLACGGGDGLAVRRNSQGHVVVEAPGIDVRHAHELVQLRAGVRVPNANRAVQGAARNQHLTVRRK